VSYFTLKEYCLNIDKKRKINKETKRTIVHKIQQRIADKLLTFA